MISVTYPCSHNIENDDLLHFTPREMSEIGHKTIYYGSQS